MYSINLFQCMSICRPISICMWIESLTYRKWLVKLAAKAPATSHKWLSYVRGYHQYKSDWLSTVARETPMLTTEFNNRQDPFAVAVIKYGYIVGHVPRTISQTVSSFLGKYGSVCFYKVTGVMLNHATGFGLEILFFFTTFMAIRPT